MLTFGALRVAALLVSAVAAAPRSVQKIAVKSIIAFGDELSDNGNGSFAHGITGNPATVYGYGTWTNGPVAVSYFADALGLPMTADYAFGGCCGAGAIVSACSAGGGTTSSCAAVRAASCES